MKGNKKLTTLITSIAIITFFVALFTLVSWKSPVSTSESTTVATSTTVVDETTTVRRNYNDIKMNVATETETEMQEDPEEIRQQLKNIIFQELKLGYDDHAIQVSYSMDGHHAAVSGPEPGWKVNAMFASKEFLKTHDIVFEYSEDPKFEKFTPPTFKSQEDYQGDAYGWVFKEELEYRQGIEWDYDAPSFRIIIDNFFEIIVNPSEAEAQEFVDSYYAIW